ncbi:MAG: 23S rRNA (pseudouridine(1915)-N(3))-methyltransferase RlmH [Nitrospirae bacterium]|nr:23S rRNA (pseudouridine(1915)-N(3))-methyltransferase RlmH [Nitrospirota bacterium]
MNINILWIGKTKERYLNEGIVYYFGLIRRMLNITVEEIKEEKDKDRDTSILLEGKRILKKTNSFFLLDEKGRQFTSMGFAEFLKSEEGKGKTDFVIGGPFGVSREVRDKAMDMISLSKMTLTHEMARLVFLEQLYRAMTIKKGWGYHH